MFKKNNTFENVVKTSGEVIATGTIASASAVGVIEVAATAACLASGLTDITKLPKKACIGIIATAATAATVTTMVAVKRLGFFKKSNQPKANDIDREQIEDYSK